MIWKCIGAKLRIVVVRHLFYFYGFCPAKPEAQIILSRQSVLFRPLCFEIMMLNFDLIMMLSTKIQKRVLLDRGEESAEAAAEAAEAAAGF